jgi:GNAT superfamily N-acetyltransferase
VSRTRLGVVLLLPDPVATEVDGLRRASGDNALGQVPPHVTLVPPVNVGAGAVDDAVAVVRAAAAASRPLVLELGPASTFSPDTPVLYLAVGGDVELLSTVRRALLVGPLDRPAEWPYVPHVTLATDVAEDRLAAGVAALADFRVAVAVHRVHLMIEGGDRVWRPLADAGLGPAAVVGRGGLPVELSVTDGLDPESGRFFSAAWLEHRQASYGPGLPPTRPFAVTARREGAVVGVAFGTLDDELVLDRLVVDRATRGQGIGSHLLHAVERMCVDRGCRRAALVVQAGGGAQMFYGNCGWVVDLVLPGWRSGRAFVRMVWINTS